MNVIVAAGSQLLQFHSDGSIWRSTGTPCNGASCPGREKLDNNVSAIAIAAGGAQIAQLHKDGSIWRYVGPERSRRPRPGWKQLDDNAAANGIVLSDAD